MARSSTPILLLVAALAGAACSGEGPLVPEGDGPAAGSVAGDPTRPDSVAPGPLPASVRAVGQVFRVTFTPGVADSLRYTAVAGARVEVLRRNGADSASAYALVRELTTDADGAYAVDGLPGGYYTLRATGPAGSGLGTSWQYLPANKAEVRVNLNLWPRGG